MPEINPEIFKSYDVRGIYPDQLDESAAYVIGRAFARKSAAERVVVGRDMRLSGEALREKFVQGVLDEGVDVIDIGLVPIDAVYFAVSKLGYPAGTMITASHNPKEYNGFKMVLPGITMIRGQELYEIVTDLPDEPMTDKPGALSEIDIMDQYIEHVLSFVDVKKIKPLNVVVDAGNGMAGKVIPLLEPHLPIRAERLNFELDGNFPAHPSNPLLPESQKQITETVVTTKADCGVIFDGDTDRLFFIDELGNFIPADLTLLLLAHEMIQREPGAGIAYNLICSKAVPEKVTEWGGAAIRTKVGFVNVAEGMREHNGIMGGELSAHYSFRDNSYSDSGFIAFLLVLQIISQSEKKLSELIAPLQIYHKSPETNLEIEDKQMVLDHLKVQYSDGEQDELDGLTVQYKDWWFNVRPSNTEPLLRVTVEAQSEKILTQKHAQLVEYIESLKN